MLVFPGKLMGAFTAKVWSSFFFYFILLSHQDSAANLNYRMSKAISLQRDHQALNNHILDHMASLFYCFESKECGHKINMLL